MSTRESTFSSFLTFDGNRRAHDLCLAVSRGEPISPLPIILLGERGSGKTHLLRAVAQRLRASAGHAAIMMVSPHSKSEEIARLVDDPKPIDMARYAVLLIDDFHALSADLDTLAKLVRVFLENDHPVVVASEVHPDRLGKMPTALQRIVRAGQLVPVEGGDAEAAIRVVERGVREAEHDTIAALEQRIRDLEAMGPEGVAREHAQRADAVDTLKRDLAEARAEIEHLRGEQALLSVSAREAVALRKRVDELERERVERAKQPTDAKPPQAEELKRNLDEARFDAQKAREEARGMLERAQLLLEELHKSRESYEAARLERERRHEDLRRFQGLAEEQLAATAEELAGAAESAEPAAAKSPDDAELAATRDELHRVQESLVRARAERDNAKSHLAHIRQELDTALADLERMRGEAAEDAAAHQARVTELEAALVARQEEIDALQAMQRAFTEEVQTLQSQVTEGADVLERLMELFGSPPTRGDADRDPDDPDGAASDVAADLRVQRADFGEGIRIVPRRGPSLHHVEEMRGQMTSFFPHLPPLDANDVDGAPDVEGKARSA